MLNFTPALQGLLPPATLPQATQGVNGGGMVSAGLQHESFVGCSSRQEASALAWIFHGPQFLREIPICSGIITGNHTKHDAACEDGHFKRVKNHPALTDHL